MWNKTFDEIKEIIQSLDRNANRNVDYMATKPRKRSNSDEEYDDELKMQVDDDETMNIYLLQKKNDFWLIENWS